MSVLCKDALISNRKDRCHGPRVSFLRGYLAEKGGSDCSINLQTFHLELHRVKNWSTMCILRSSKFSKRDSIIREEEKEGEKALIHREAFRVNKREQEA